MEEIELIVGIFDLPDLAGKTLKDLDLSAKAKTLRLVHAAEIHKDLSGKAHLNDRADVDAKHGALAGAIFGGILGLAAGPAGAALGAIAGATTGGVAAGKIDLGFSSDFLNDLKTSLKPGTSALLVIVETQWGDQVDRIMDANRAQVLRHALREDLVNQIAAAQKNREEEAS